MAEKIIEHSAISMYEKDQSVYSIVVNRRRAIPAVQDGLKPVQRRVVFAAYKDHLIKPQLKDKSASLVGTTMKYYHAHGNCLRGNTLVYIPSGNKYTTIEALYNAQLEEDQQIPVYSVYLEHKSVVNATAHHIRIGQYTNKVYHIELSNHGEICCTENHPILMKDGSYKEAKDIKVNDILYKCNYSDKGIVIFRESYMEIPDLDSLYVKNIYIESVYKEPMYDFTVDGYENMCIPVFDKDENGNTTGNVHFVCVHNSSIYDAISVLAAWYKTKYPLFYGKGNWGNVSGAGPAAERYTECALSNFGYDIMIDELAQANNIVDWIDTYKRNGDKEPEYLPAKLPNLLINGSFGIGVGMTINVPSHNLGEVIDATIDLLKNPNKKIVLIPDLAQACELLDADWEEISCTGRGTFKVRGVINTEQDKKGNYILHINSLPDQVSCNQVYDKISEMISAKQMPMIKDIYNSLTKDEKPDIIIVLRPGADPGYVKQAIYAKTGVQKSVSVNFEAVSSDGIALKRYSYRDYLLEFIDQRMSIKFRLYCNKLQQVMTRHMQVDAFVKILQSKEFDKIMTMIRKYNGTDDDPIIEFMIKNCNITDIQAKFILGRTLPQLSKGHLKRYIEERKDLQAKIDSYTKYVTDDGTMIKEELIGELKELKAKYNTPRLCKVISSSMENDIPKGTFKVVITERNFVRKVPDVDRVGVVRKDNPKFILRVDNAENILIFDNKGKVFNLPVHKIPITDKQGAGTDIRILVKNLTSNIAAVFYEPIFKKLIKGGAKHYLTILTQSNTIKKLDIEDFLNVGPSGLMYSKIRPEDEVVGVALVPHNLDIAICSGHKVLRCNLKDVPLYKRNASGARAMGTMDPINGMSVIYPDSKDIVVITKNGYINKFDNTMLTPHSRARKGVKVIKLGSTDEILNVFGVNDTDKIRVLTSEGAEEILVSDVKKKSTIASGTKMIKAKSPIVKADIIR